LTRLIFVINIVTIIIAKNPPDRQGSKTLFAGVGEGRGVGPGRGAGKSVGAGLLTLVLVLVAVGITDSVPVIDNLLSRTRDSAEVVSSPKKRKLGVSYGSGKPSNLL
jgi:hypothetical protein